MRTVLVGAVEGSRAALEAMCGADYAPALVVTLPAELASRHSDFADLGPVAESRGIPVHRTQRSESDETKARIAEVAPDVVLVIGWSQLCGPEFRALAKVGTIGFHPSALPRLRGRGVIPWTILTGATQGGASLFWLGDGADTGDIAAQHLFEIDPHEETARSLYDKAIVALTAMLPPLLDRLAGGERPAEAQDDREASLCARRRPSDGEIDWSRPAEAVHRLVRAVGPPYPGAFTHTAKGERITIHGARMTPRHGYYIGLPGQIQAVNGDTFTVQCGDGGCIDIHDWTGPGTPPAIHSHLAKAPS